MFVPFKAFPHSASKPMHLCKEHKHYDTCPGTGVYETYHRETFTVGLVLIINNNNNQSLCSAAILFWLHGHAKHPCSSVRFLLSLGPPEAGPVTTTGNCASPAVTSCDWTVDLRGVWTMESEMGKPSKMMHCFKSWPCSSCTRMVHCFPVSCPMITEAE